MTQPIGDFKVVSLSVIISAEVSGGYGEGDQVELLYGG